MCGLAGFLDNSHSLSSESLNALSRKMSDTLKNRGPDDAGSWVDQKTGIAMSHRRLAIQDTSLAGHQPMVSKSGRYVIVYNGEIYNYRILRRELKKTGYVFRSQSDTEVLLAAVEVWGLNIALDKFIGMFAFALWDKDNRELYLVRDRVGEKPLYYGLFGNIILFGSELKALEVHDSFVKSINRNAISLLLRYNYIPAPYSIYDNIYKIKPGTFLTIKVEKQKISTTEHMYWSFENTVKSGCPDNKIFSYEEAKFGIKDALTESIRSQMIADVPLGAFLSGGIDSSLIVSIMQSLSSNPIKTYTIGFDHSEYNEANDAKLIANYLGTEHTELYVTAAQAHDVIPKIPNIFDEPFADSSQIPTYLISKLASSDVTVSLSGDGGDELFGGYNRYCKGYSAWKNLSRMPYPINYFFSEIIHSINPYKWNLLYNYLGKYITNERRHKNIGDKLYKMADIVKINSPQDMYLSLVSFWDNTEEIVLNSSEPMTIPRDYNNWIGNLDDRENMMFLDTISYLPDDILTKVDRSSMAVSLESRAPFLNHALIELSQRIPIELKIKEGKGKWILRNILNDFIPTNFIDKPKTGFGVPIAEWLRGPLKEWAESLIDNSRLKHDGYFNAVLVSDMWEKHINKDRNYGHHLWSILMFQAWLETK
jgi:asparagine synthase (glutamine-hydrolysing)